MELFKITCVTCRARLSVRDASLIGQIIGCPRCGMMVQIAAPVGAAALVEPAPEVASAATVDAVPTFDDAALETAAQLPSPLSAPIVDSVPTFEDAVVEPAAADGLNTAPAVVAEAAIASAPSGWSSFKFGAVLVGGGVLGSIIVAAALSFLNRSEPQSAAAKPPTAPHKQPQQPEATAPAKAAEPVQPNDAAPATDPPVASDAPVAEDALLPVEVAQSPAPAAEPVESPAAEQLAAAAPVEPPASTTEAPSPPAAEPPKIRIDPLDVDPEGLDLATLYSAPAKDPLAESQLPAAAEPPPSVPPAEPPQPAQPAPEIKQAVRRDDRAGVGAPVNVAAILSRRLPAVELKKAPLCRVLDLAVQLSGMPVSVAPQELRMAGVGATASASVSGKDATIEQLLTAAGGPLRLKPVVDGQQIVLKQTREDRRRPVDYPVDDLANGPDQVARLAEWVGHLTAPEAWQARGGDATLTVDGAKLRVEASLSVQYEVLFLLERMRLTRGLPARSKYPSALLGQGAFHASVAERLSAPAVFTFAEYAPLREVLRYWQEEMEVAVLVDWPALAGERLWPQTRVACSAVDQPWSEAIDSVLTPLGLSWRAVDHRTIEITTAAKVAAEPMLEVYRLADGAAGDADELAARVRALIDDGGAAEGIVVDAPAQLLMIRQAASVHRKLIRELASELAPPAGEPL